MVTRFRTPRVHPLADRRYDRTDENRADKRCRDACTEIRDEGKNRRKGKGEEGGGRGGRKGVETDQRVQGRRDTADFARLHRPINHDRLIRFNCAQRGSRRVTNVPM